MTEEMRLECLRLAIGSLVDSNDAINVARRFENYVAGLAREEAKPLPNPPASACGPFGDGLSRSTGAVE